MEKAQNLAWQKYLSYPLTQHPLFPLQPPKSPVPLVVAVVVQANEADLVIRLSALSALRSLLSLWDLDPEQCLAPALGWLVPALYGMFEAVEEMDNRQEVGGATCRSRVKRGWCC